VTRRHGRNLHPVGELGAEFCEFLGVRYARSLCGRSALYSVRQRSIFSFASAGVVNQWWFQTRVAESSVKAFHVPVLHRPPRLNMDQANTFAPRARPGSGDLVDSGPLSQRITSGVPPWLIMFGDGRAFERH
jgi:hypothetical protein